MNEEMYLVKPQTNVTCELLTPDERKERNKYYKHKFIGVYSTTAKYTEKSIHKGLTLKYVIMFY